MGRAGRNGAWKTGLHRNRRSSRGGVMGGLGVPYCIVSSAPYSIELVPGPGESLVETLKLGPVLFSMMSS